MGYVVARRATINGVKYDVGDPAPDDLDRADILVRRGLVMKIPSGEEREARLRLRAEEGDRSMNPDSPLYEELKQQYEELKAQVEELREKAFGAEEEAEKAEAEAFAKRQEAETTTAAVTTLATQMVDVQSKLSAPPSVAAPMRRLANGTWQLDQSPLTPEQVAKLEAKGGKLGTVRPGDTPVKPLVGRDVDGPQPTPSTTSVQAADSGDGTVVANQGGDSDDGIQARRGRRQ